DVMAMRQVVDNVGIRLHPHCGVDHVPRVDKAEPREVADCSAENGAPGQRRQVATGAKRYFGHQRAGLSRQPVGVTEKIELRQAMKYYRFIGYIEREMVTDIIFTHLDDNNIDGVMQHLG